MINSNNSRIWRAGSLFSQQECEEVSIMHSKELDFYSRFHPILRSSLPLGHTQLFQELPSRICQYIDEIARSYGDPKDLYKNVDRIRVPENLNKNSCNISKLLKLLSLIIEKLQFEQFLHEEVCRFKSIRRFSKNVMVSQFNTCS